MNSHSNSSLVWIAALTILMLASCERVPSKSDYVSARVTELCGGLPTQELQTCRVAVITQFADTPLEEMKLRYPPPEPRSRPSCGL